MWGKIFYEIIQLAKDYWYRPVGIILVVFLEWLFVVLSWESLKVIDPTSVRVGIILTINLATILLWHRSVRIEVFPKDCVGILVAIKVIDKDEKIRIRSIVVDEFNKYLSSQTTNLKFKVQTLQDYYSEGINNFSDAERFLNKSSATLIVFGSVSKETQGSEHFMFRLDGIVQHRAIPQDLSQKMSVEFASIFPKNLAFAKEKELFGFAMTRQWLGYAVKYMVAIASFVSGSFDTALGLLTGLHQELSSVESLKRIPALTEMKRKIPLRIAEVCNSICISLYQTFVRTRNIKYISEQKPYLDLLWRYMPDNNKASISRAIYIFLIENNIREAKRHLRRYKIGGDETWRICLAFLQAYEGDIIAAKKSYDKAFKGTFGDNVLNDSEVFMGDFLSRVDSPVSLYFARAYLNFRGKGDYHLANEDFNKFLSATVGSGAEFNEPRRLAETYIREITT